MRSTASSLRYWKKTGKAGSEQRDADPGNDGDQFNESRLRVGEALQRHQRDGKEAGEGATRPALESNAMAPFPQERGRREPTNQSESQVFSIRCRIMDREDHMNRGETGGDTRDPRGGIPESIHGANYAPTTLGWLAQRRRLQTRGFKYR